MIVVDDEPEVIGLFEGYGGLTTAVRSVLGGRFVAYSEIEPAACRVLEHHYPDVPNLGDITEVDWDAARGRLTPGRVLIVTGGFPCTDVSSAGRRLGLRPGTRSGLWSQMRYGIGRLHPDLVVIENVRGLLSADAETSCDVDPCPWCVGEHSDRPLRALGAVLGDLAELGYDAQWCGLRAADARAPHGRFRVFVAAWPAADPHGLRPLRSGAARGWRRGPAVHDLAAADASSDGWNEGRAESARLVGRSDAAVGSVGAAADAVRDGREGHPERDLGSEAGQPAPLGGDAARRVLDWGAYEPAIRRWEQQLRRVAPEPTMTGKRGGQQLSPAFVEWMMGLPEGWVTAVPGVSRNEQLKMLGNGVVPQQAELALRWLLATSSQASEMKAA